jgi:hypothetical protein
MTEFVNAFHPDYAKTYETKLLDSIRIQNRHKLSSHAMSEFTEEQRKTNPSVGTIHHMLKPLHVMRAPEMMMKKKLSTQQRVDLAPREFKVYSRAGTANVTPKGKKK